MEPSIRCSEVHSDRQIEQLASQLKAKPLPQAEEFLQAAVRLPQSRLPEVRPDSAHVPIREYRGTKGRRGGRTSAQRETGLHEPLGKGTANWTGCNMPAVISVRIKDDVPRAA